MLGKSEKDMEELMRRSKKAIQALMLLPARNYYKKEVSDE